jgi:hypothetical protein
MVKNRNLLNRKIHPKQIYTTYTPNDLLNKWMQSMIERNKIDNKNMGEVFG